MPLTASEVRETVLDVFASSAVPAPVVQAFLSDLLNQPDRDTAASTRDRLLRRFHAWRDQQTSSRGSVGATSTAGAATGFGSGSGSGSGSRSRGGSASSVGAAASRPATAESSFGAGGRGGLMSDSPVPRPATASSGDRRAPPMTEAKLDDDADGPVIRCVVRKRPMSKSERRRKEPDVIDCVSRRSLLVHEPKQKVDLTNYTEVHRYSFDEVFDERVDTEEIYRHTAAPLVSSVFRGTNATCFAYGQTGSGKTYTMMGGGGSSPGLYMLAAKDIFRLQESSYPHLQAYVSFYEVRVWLCVCVSVCLCVCVCVSVCLCLCLCVREFCCLAMALTFVAARAPPRFTAASCTTC